MNLQTIKPRARWQPNLGCWLITHPLSDTSAFAHRPHDAAVALLREYVLPRQVELMGGAA